MTRSDGAPIAMTGNSIARQIPIYLLPRYTGSLNRGYKKRGIPMDYFFAPMEGLTDAVYRHLHH
ncbi:MAG: hypothetical protein SPG79_02375, partial [Candidatus Faecousia sp.]|nr:hypothetical protein [Candidatus Faecousia sp.]